jgi:hypothetical protein
MKMLEKSSENGLAEQFECFLALSSPPAQAPVEIREDLRLAGQLRGMNLSAESQIQDRLRARLAQKVQAACPVKSTAQHSTALPRLWLGAAIAIVMILFLATNAPARVTLGRLFGWMTAVQTNPTPNLVLTLADTTPTNTRTAGLPMHLPENGPLQSPTPGILETAPSHPIAVPTPGAQPPP